MVQPVMLVAVLPREKTVPAPKAPFNEGVTGVSKPELATGIAVCARSGAVRAGAKIARAGQWFFMGFVLSGEVVFWVLVERQGAAPLGKPCGTRNVTWKFCRSFVFRLLGANAPRWSEIEVAISVGL